MVKAVVSLSGGMDSATVLAMALHSCDEVRCVGFAYSSKHNRWENAAAEAVASYYKVPFTLVDLSEAFKHFKSDLLLSGGDVPHGHYEAESMRRTVVPARNLIFASILAGLAVSSGATQVWLGVHAGDHAIYPDCRPEFLSSLGETVKLATGEPVEVVAPFLYGNKVSILRTGMAFTPQVPYHLTRTCYSADEMACGLCGACQERKMAFETVGVEDLVPCVAGHGTGGVVHV